MIKKPLLILTLLSIFVLSAPLLVILQGQTADKLPLPTPNATKPSQQSIDEIRKNFPSVDYINDRAVDESRQNKSSKYGRHKVLYPEIYEDGQIASSGDWLSNPSSLPLADSEIVLIGEVVGAEAHLSSNKNSVYSEFEIKIEKIIKNSRNEEFDGKSILAEREGGIVNFPTGFKTWYFVSGQRMPKVGSRYVFFLTHKFIPYGDREKDLFILTGYELRDGKVYPLDAPNGGTHPVATFYNGKDESILLNDLKDALKTLKKASPK
jgi:hypothetical protein